MDRHLIIEKRNRAILDEYLNRANGDKAIGFCCSIKHAERMAEFFNENGIPSASITSETKDRKQKIDDFRNNKYAVAFTVDLFNEGINFPNVRVLMFIRPTESKTVFTQQLGRGLRLSIGKERVIVLDFIGNYRKANKIRQYLAFRKKEKKDGKTGRVEKVIYEYAPKCEVHFEAEVEEILDRQDSEERGVSKEDLVDAYYELAEELGRRPAQEDINTRGEFKIARYVSLFGSWVKFLRDTGEFTEASYHYPQGVHLGHVLYILKIIGKNKGKSSLIDDRFVRMRGNLDSGRLGAFQRQTKYKLQGMMEMGLVTDDRTFGLQENYELSLTPEGRELYDLLESFLSKIDLSFSRGSGRIPSWNMELSPQDFNVQIWEFIRGDKRKREFVQKLFLNVHAVSQMLNYIYKIERKREIKKAFVYLGFFKAPFVRQYCDQNGIEIATEEGARHRCPFLLNTLEAIGILSQTRDSVTVNKFVISKETVKLKPKESKGETLNRINALTAYITKKTKILDSEEVSLLKESFGKNFLTDKYYLSDFEILI